MIFESDNQESLERSVTNILSSKDVSLDDVNKQITSSDKSQQDAIDDFLNQYNFEISDLAFYHLARRLKGDEETTGKTLVDLLTQKSYLSDFFKLHDIEFSYDLSSESIVLFYHGKVVDLDNITHKVHAGTIPRLKGRFGRNDLKDYCFNGFAFGDNIEHSTDSYYIGLKDGPELVRDIEDLLDIKGLSTSFCEQSIYYCYKYIVPIEDMFVLSNPKMATQDKTNLVLSYALENILQYNQGEKGTRNIKIGYSDSKNLPEKLFVTRWEII